MTIAAKSRRHPLVCAAALLISLSAAWSQTAVLVDPQTKYQRLEGWGTSLCWWANMTGAWTDAALEPLCDALTQPDGLNFNVFRFNIGGGDAPDHQHMRKDGAAMPGYKPAKAAPYDWNADAPQRKVMLRLKQKRPDAIFEAFANSPPWWLTKSGCASGNTDGSNNLRDDAYADFADYLAEVVRHYQTNYGIVFRTLEPMNEPDAYWWKAKNKQEGCKFTVDKQVQLVRELHKKLAAKGLLSRTQISAMDANSLNSCYKALTGPGGYQAAQIFPLLAQINVHTYFGDQRAGIAQVAARHRLRVWQSESGPLNLKEKGLDILLLMAQRIVTDLRQLKPVAWVDWQAVTSGDSPWGLCAADYAKQTWHKTKSYYVRMQFSRFFKPGGTFIASNHDHTLAALNPGGTELVLAVCNQTAAEMPIVFDLQRFPSLAGEAKVFRTSEKENCEPLPALAVANRRLAFSAAPKSVTTLIKSLKD